MTLNNKKQYLLTSDWHIGHRRMEILCNRPTNFEALITENLLRACAELHSTGHDIEIVNLGDVCWTNKDSKQGVTAINRALKLFSPLHYLVKGNHDRATNKQYLEMGFTSVQKDMFLSIPYSLEEDYDIHFTHRPINETVLKPLFAENIHGHLHQNLPAQIDRQFLISQELLDYRPITLEEVLRIGTTPKWDGEKFVSAYDKV